MLPDRGKTPGFELLRGDPAGAPAFGSWLNGPCGTALTSSRILTGPALRYILYRAASIGHPARSPLIRLAVRRFEIAKCGATGCVPCAVARFQHVRSMKWMVGVDHLFAERRVPPGAIFREKIEGRWYRMYLRTGPDQAGS